MKECALDAFAMAVTSAVVAPSFPYKMFSRILVAKRAGSWFTSPICPRSQRNCKFLMLCPSRSTSPALHNSQGEIRIYSNQACMFPARSHSDTYQVKHVW